MNVAAPEAGSNGRVRRLLRSLNCDGVRGLALLALCAALLLPELGGDAVRSALRYERAAIAEGEWWRFATAHVVHLDPEHAALNALGLVLMWALFARDYRAFEWLLVVLIAVVAIDLGFWFRDPQLEWYVGSSGVLHGVMTAGTLAHVLRRDLDGWILAAFIVVKLGYEQWAGSMPFADGGAPVVVNSHLYGSAGGLCAAILILLLRRLRREAEA